jgi:hypothetical protein
MNTPRNWALLLGLILTALTLAGLAGARPMLMHDTGWGLLTWDSFRAGGPFNHLSTPRLSDPGTFDSGFLSWWSPGQYLPVGLLSLTGLDLGQSMVISSLLGCLLAAAGWRAWGRAIGMSDTLALALATVQVLSNMVLRQFGAYFGGELVVAGALPWLLLLAWRCRDLPSWQPLLLLVLMPLAGFLKHSFLTTALGVPLYWLLEHKIRHRAGLAGSVRQALLLGAGTIAGLLLWYWLYLSRGPAPSSPGDPIPAAVALGYPLLGPWLSATGLGALVGRLCFLTGTDLAGLCVSHGPSILFTGLVLLGGVLLLLRRHPLPSVARLCVAILLANIGSLILLYWRNASVSFEERHLYAGGCMLLAAALSALPAMTARWGRLLAAALLLITAGGLASTALRELNLARMHRIGPRGFMQPDLEPALLTKLAQLDRDLPRNTLFLLPKPTMVLEVTHHPRRQLNVKEGVPPGSPWPGSGPCLVILEEGAGPLDGRPSWQGKLPGYRDWHWSCSGFEGYRLWQCTPSLTETAPHTRP